MEIPERMRHMLDRTGLVEVGRVTAQQALRAIGNSVPTFADARRLTDATIAALGERAIVEHENGPQRWVYLRDPEDDAWLVAPAILDEQGWGPTGDVPVPRRDRIVPKGPDMHAGKLVLSLGGARLSLEFDAVGMRCGCADGGGDTFALCYERNTRPFVIDPSARPPTPLPLPLLLRADLQEDGHEIEQLAVWIAELAVAVTDGVRLRAPARLPLGSQAIVLRARHSAAVALWQGLVDRDARWLVLDGLCGRAFSSGSTREEAWSRFGPAVWREKPGLLGTLAGEPLGFELPPRRVDEGERPLHLPTRARSAEDGGPVTALSFEGSFSFGPFVSAHEWPSAEPETMPALLVPIPPAPRVDERWTSAGFEAVAIVGEGGTLGWMLRREEGDGWTLVGADVADLVDPETLLEGLECEQRRYVDDWREMFPDGWDALPPPRVMRFGVWNVERQHAMSPRCTQLASGGFHPVDLDATKDRWGLVRVWL